MLRAALEGLVLLGGTVLHVTPGPGHCRCVRVFLLLSCLISISLDLDVARRQTLSKSLRKATVEVLRWATAAAFQEVRQLGFLVA